MKYKLVGPNDPVLWSPAAPVQESEDLSFIAGMERIFRMSPVAVGLAAPQIGISKQVILVAPHVPQGFVERKKAEVVFVANPEVTWFSNEMDRGLEGCLSFPGVTAYVNAYRHITVIGRRIINFQLQPPSKFMLSDWAARVWLHEMLHLKGQCLVGNEWRRLNDRSH